MGYETRIGRIAGCSTRPRSRRYDASEGTSNAAGEIAGIAENIARCEPRAVAVITLDYTTGRTVTWATGCDLEMWERPLRRSARAALTIDRVMASAALPMVFPAVLLGKHWHGDGGIRLAAPLSPALHLGATRMLAISTHDVKSFSEADEPQIAGYPSGGTNSRATHGCDFSRCHGRGLPAPTTFERVPARPASRAATRVSADRLRCHSPLAGSRQTRRRVRASTATCIPVPDAQSGNAGNLERRFHEPVHVRAQYLQRLIEIGEADAEAKLAAIVRVAPSLSLPS